MPRAGLLAAERIGCEAFGDGVFHRGKNGVGGEVVGPDEDGVGGDLKGVIAAVVVVAGLDAGDALGEGGLVEGDAVTVGVAFGAGGFGGVEVELDVGVGEDDGALVAAVADDARVFEGESALFFDEDVAEGLNAGVGRDDVVDLGGSDAVSEGDAACDDDGRVVVPVEGDPGVADELNEGAMV